MRSARIAAAGIAFYAAAACRPISSPPPAQPEPAPRRGPGTVAEAGIPPGHLPPPGQCRIWKPETPPGHQAKARSCSNIARNAPAGSWIVERSREDRNVVFIRVVDDRRPGVVIRTRVYEIRGGKLARKA